MNETLLPTPRKYVGDDYNGMPLGIGDLVLLAESDRKEVWKLVRQDRPPIPGHANTYVIQDPVIELVEPAPAEGEEPKQCEVRPEGLVIWKAVGTAVSSYRHLQVDR